MGRQLMRIAKQARNVPLVCRWQLANFNHGQKITVILGSYLRCDYDIHPSCEILQVHTVLLSFITKNTATLRAFLSYLDSLRMITPLPSIPCFITVRLYTLQPSLAPKWFCRLPQHTHGHLYISLRLSTRKKS